MRSRFLKTVALAAATVLCFGMTAMAADSASGTVVKTDELKITEADKSETDAAKDKFKDSTVVDVVDVTYPDGFPEDGKKDVSFTVPGAKKGDSGFVAGLVDGQWVKLPTVVGDGTMTVTLDGKKATALAFILEGQQKTSPKTSASMAPAMMALGLAAFAGVCALSMKKKEN